MPIANEFDQLPKEDKADLFYNYWNLLAQDAPHPKREYKFHERCKWRFDFAWPDPYFVAVEIDGNAWHVKGGGKHGTDKDREKINNAVMRGWAVLRFSPQQVENDPCSVCRMVKQLLARGGNTRHRPQKSPS